MLWKSPVFTQAERWISNTKSFPRFVLMQQVSQWILSWIFSLSLVGWMDCLEFKYYTGCWLGLTDCLTMIICFLQFFPQFSWWVETMVTNSQTLYLKCMQSCSKILQMIIKLIIFLIIYTIFQDIVGWKVSHILLTSTPSSYFWESVSLRRLYIFFFLLLETYLLFKSYLILWMVGSYTIFYLKICIN